MSYVTLNDLADLAGREATDAEKHRASVMANQGDRQGVIALMGPLNQWESSTRPVMFGGWYSSQDVILRASTTFAERNPSLVTAAEFTSRMQNPLRAGEALTTAGTYWRDRAREVAPDGVPWWVWAAGGTAVAGVGLFYFGGFIKAAGHLAERATSK